MLHRFDAAEERIERIESEAESLDMGRKGQTLTSEFDQLERNERVEEALAELKSRRNKE
jgi:phage shock protein A